MFKKLISIFIVLCSVAVLTGCSSSSNSSTGSSTTFTIEDLGNASEGYYILHEDGTFESLIAPKYSGNLYKSAMDATRIYIKTLSDLEVPTLGPNDSLIIISNSTPSAEVSLYGFEKMYYTLGTSFASSGNNTYTFGSSNNVTEGSSAESVLGKSNTSANVVSVGSQNMNSELLSESGSLMNLEDGSKYEIVWYEGTRMNEKVVIADCVEYASVPSKLYKFSELKYTKSGYAVLMLDENMESGYYYIDNGGFFYYDKNGEG